MFRHIRPRLPFVPATCCASAFELDTRVGEELESLQEQGGWLRVRNRNGLSGWVPADSVKRA